ncbi:hypothetical protein [Sulfuricurvum sp.]|uniref:hypothetical protein n=1 Tax=Sulfuricurvum sp. TaxID=2025608 RepID=UPI0025E86DFB|nr:hypothetical protein [Sulfuricurvum sp.]
MLFYNHNQEFIGIDEESLKLLNYTTLEELLQVCSDVADLFAKEPGYIHNFKSFGWIDFLLHADSDARSAIVHGNGRTFSCTLQVKSLFLSADPSSPGYIIDMLHIQSLSEDDVKPQIFAKKAKPEIKPPLFETQPIETAPSILPNYDHIIPTPLSEPGVLDVPSYNEQDIEEEPIEDLYAKLSLPLNEEELEKDYFVPEASLSFEPEPEPILNRPVFEDVRYSSAEKEFINTLKVDSSYLFDPNVAAQELGLPVDLIQEFIGDFIQQANEFKEELFEAALRGDMNNLKILSHKLKGVAANLRIEDAFETLNIINTSNDPIEIEANLKYFYNIISKLEGKEIAKEKSNEDIGNDLLYPLEEPIFLSEDESVFPPLPSNDDDIYTFDAKDDNTPLLLQEEDLYSTPLRDEDIISSPYEEAIPLFEENFSEKSIETEPSEPVHSDDIYTFDLKDDNSPLLLQEEIPPVSYENESLIDTQPFEERVREESIPAEPMQSLHYDKTFIAGQLGIELDFFDELIDEYKLDALRAGNEISASISAFDTHAWKKTASQLKGISDNLRLNEISDELAILSQTNDAQEANKASKRLNSFLEQL